MTSSPTRPLRIATYNIHKCVGPDNRHAPDRTFAILKALEADVVAVQEFDSRPRKGRGPISVEDFERALGFHAIAQPTIVENGGFHGNLILSRRPPATVRRVDITAPLAEMRGAILARFDGGSGLWVVATHLGLSPGARRHQLGRMFRELYRYAGDEPDTPVVVLGDMNDWMPFGGARRLLARHFATPRLARSYPARRPLLALDQIWARPPGLLDKVWVHDTAEARNASDHLPVVAELGED